LLDGEEHLKAQESKSASLSSSPEEEAVLRSVLTPFSTSLPYADSELAVLSQTIDGRTSSGPSP
jgi:hypothetical protein